MHNPPVHHYHAMAHGLRDAEFSFFGVGREVIASPHLFDKCMFRLSDNNIIFNQ